VVVEIVNPRRGRGRHKANLTLKDVYKYYNDSIIKDYKSKLTGETKKSPYSMTRSTFTGICKMFNELLIEALVLENFEFFIPYRQGTLSIIKRKTSVYYDENGKLKSNLRVDYQATRKLWEQDMQAFIERRRVYHLNEHTDGYNYGFYWRKTYSKVPQGVVYSFKASRGMARFLAKAVKENPKLDFFEKVRIKQRKPNTD
jgi:hypothetical protein